MNEIINQESIDSKYSCPVCGKLYKIGQKSGKSRRQTNGFLTGKHVLACVQGASSWLLMGQNSEYTGRWMKAQYSVDSRKTLTQALGSLALALTNCTSYHGLLSMEWVIYLMNVKPMQWFVVTSSTQDTAHTLIPLTSLIDSYGWKRADVLNVCFLKWWLLACCELLQVSITYIIWSPTTRTSKIRWYNEKLLHIFWGKVIRFPNIQPTTIYRMELTSDKSQAKTQWRSGLSTK